MLSTLLISIICLVISIPSSAQTKTYIKNDSIHNTEEYSLQRLNKDHTIFNQFYATTPSLLKQYTLNEFTMVSLGYESNNYDFHDITMPDNKNSFLLETENLLSLNGGWHIFGRFRYINGSADNTSYNLHLGKPDNGSPVYYFTPKEGDWNFQKYIFTAYISKKINNKWSLGTTIDYIGDLRFRTVDIRNDLTELKVHIGPSVTYQISNSQNISFGYLFNRRKGQPSISKKYPHTGSTTDYNVYINTGFGSYLKSAPWETKWIDIAHKFSLTWDYHKDNSIYNINYSLSTGQELWTRTSIDYQADTGENISKHTYMKHEIKLNQILNLSNGGQFVNYLNFDYLSGNTDMSEKSIYSPTFKVSMANDDAQSTYYWKNNSWLESAQINFNFDHYKGTDQKYGQTYDYNNLDSWISVCFGHKLGWKAKKINLTLDAGYKANISYNHDALAASSNLFTLNILNSQIVYQTASLAHGGIDINYTIPFKKYRLQCGVKYSLYSSVCTHYDEVFNNFADYDTNDDTVANTVKRLEELQDGINQSYTFRIFFFF